MDLFSYCSKSFVGSNICDTYFKAKYCYVFSHFYIHIQNLLASVLSSDWMVEGKHMNIYEACIHKYRCPFMGRINLNLLRTARLWHRPYSHVASHGLSWNPRWRNGTCNKTIVLSSAACCLKSGPWSFFEILLISVKTCWKWKKITQRLRKAQAVLSFDQIW